MSVYVANPSERRGLEEVEENQGLCLSIIDSRSESKTRRRGTLTIEEQEESPVRPPREVVKRIQAQIIKEHHIRGEGGGAGGNRRKGSQSTEEACIEVVVIEESQREVVGKAR